MTDIRILVVDDEPAIHRFLSPALTAAGYGVARADDAAGALRAIATIRRMRCCSILACRTWTARR